MQQHTQNAHCQHKVCQHLRLQLVHQWTNVHQIFFYFNAEVMAVDQVCYRFSVCQCQFLTLYEKIVGGAPILSGVQASKTRTFFSACKNFGAQHPLGAEIWYSEKFDFRGIIALVNLQNQWTKVHQTFFAQRRRKCCRSNSFPTLDISIRSGDIRTQSEKGSEIGPKLACFSPPFGGSPPNFWTCVIK